MRVAQMRTKHKNRNLWWTPIENALKGISLQGLKVTCPLCQKPGLVITRWVKGPALKPIYIFHIKYRKVRKVCTLNQEQSDTVRGKASIFESDINTLLKSRKAFVLFSGGQDSLATLFYMQNLAKRVKCDLTALYVDTTVGLPENTRYVRKVCRYLGISLKVVRPKVDYFTLAKKWGIPSFGYRWCCRELKIKPIEDFLARMKEPKVVFDGIRAEESRLRKQYIPIWYHPSFKCLSVSPIFHWSKPEVISLINSNGLPKTLLHTLGSSTECWCGAYKTETDFKKLYELNREMFYKLAEIEKETKYRYTFLYKNGQQIPLKDLEKQILRERKKG